jgi:hypothetical protein
MSRPRTAQEFIHWLEVGEGARWLRLAAVLAGTLALSLLIAWKQFHGPVTEVTLLQAGTGRQLARGDGFTTLVNLPQSAAHLQQRGTKFDLAKPYPELHHAPLYPMVIGAALWLLPESRREWLFAAAPEPPDGFRADYFLLGLNLVLLWLATWLTYALGRRVFEPRVGWLAALAVLVSMPIWQQAVAVNGTPLLMVLALLTFWVWHRAETAADAGGAPAMAWQLALGAACGLLFLADYAAGALAIVALAYAAWRFSDARRWLAIAAVAVGFALLTAPWVIRNIRLSGHPVALAAQNVALKAGDSTAEPASARASLTTELARIDLNKLGNKALTSLQENLKSRLWSGGAMCFAAFFFAGCFYAFRSTAANRLRWWFTFGLGVLLVAQASLNSGEGERLVAVWLAPLIVVFGAGFFWVLLGANEALSRWPRVVVAAVLAFQAAPLVHDALEPRRLHFQYPPYFPALFRGVHQEFARRGPRAEKFGFMADVPAGMAWYAGVRVWAQPPKMRDFYAITLEQPIGALLLTPGTLDRPFFSDLNAKAVLPVSLGTVANRFGEWGEVYAGLLTGNFPPELPLGSRQKLAENLYVLLNPALPPPLGK